MESYHINIGTTKCCFFLPISLHLTKTLNTYPFLPKAIEEALECSKLGYYSAGILALSQLLNVFKKQTPKARHAAAHKMLVNPPAKDDYENIKALIETVCKKKQEDEKQRYNDHSKYFSKVAEEWNKTIGVKYNMSINFD